MNDLSAPTGPDDQFEWKGNNGPRHVRLYRGAPVRLADTLVVFFAPGGFVVDELDEADHCLRVLAETCEVNILAPKQPFPAAVEDAHSVLTQAIKHKQKLGWRGTRLFVSGVEACGNLAAVSALVCRDRQGPPLRGQILITPVLDANLRCPSMRCAVDDPAKRDVVQAVEQACRPLWSCTRRATRSPTKPWPMPASCVRLAMTFTKQPCPPAELHDNKDRCELTAEAPCVLAMKHFIDSSRPS